MTTEKAIAFAKPITLSSKQYTHFEMQEASVQNMFDVEMELARLGGGAHTPLAFNGQMMVLQLTKVSNDKGDMFEGPFTINMLKNWGTQNYRALRNQQLEIDLLGEAEQSDQA